MLRIFSKSNDLSCNDYIKNVKGKTILSNLKTNNFNNRNVNIHSNKIVSYLSYNDFLVITQTFYKFSNLKKKYKPPQQIIDLKTSFLFYNKILNHIQQCNFCKLNTIDIFFTNCKEIQNILYSYGEHFTYEIYSNLASVDLNDWCRKGCINNILCESVDNKNQDISNNDLLTELSKYSYNSSTNDSHNTLLEKPLSVTSFDTLSVSSYESLSITSNNLSSHKQPIISDNSSSKIDSSNIQPMTYSNFKSNNTTQISSNDTSSIQPNIYTNFKSENELSNVSVKNISESTTSSNDTSSIQPNIYSNFKSNNESSSVSNNSSTKKISNIISDSLSNKHQPIESDIHSNYIVNSNYKSVEKSHNDEPTPFHNTSTEKYILNKNWSKNNQEKIFINDKPNITFDKQVINNINSRSNYVINTMIPGTKTTFNIFIAELTNSKEYTYDEKDSHIYVESENRFYNVYNFIPICLHLDEFKNIFFNSKTKYFNISDVISEKIKLSSQYFENVNNEIEPFFISNAIKKIYIEKNNYNEMDANTLIEIEKESQDFVSLYDFNYITNSLNLDDIIYIINKNNIDLDCDIKIKIKVYYKSKKTDIPCIMYFNYILKNIK